SMLPPPPRSTPLPYTTLFRSPVDPTNQELWDAVKNVPDPEVPVLTIEDLGILRGAELVDGKPVVTITPTYSGCPAMETISADVRSEEHTSELQSRENLVCRLL